MKNQDKSEQRLIDELRQRVAELERASQEKEAEAALLLQVAPIGVHACDTNGRITFVNPCQERITGYTAEELVGTYIWDRIEPGPQKDSLPIYLKKLVSDQPPPTPFVTRNIRKNGEVFDVRIDWNYIRNPQGQVTGFVSIVSDITGQRKSDVARLQQSYAELQAIYDGMVDGLLIVDAETKQFVRANTSICTMLGYLEEELLSKSIMDLHPAKDLPAILETFQAQVEGRLRIAMDIPVIRKDGSEFFADVAASSLRYHDRPCLIGFFRDITERKRAEEALRQVSERLSLATRTANVGIWDMDIPNDKLVWDDAMFRLYGITPNDFLGAYEAWQSGVHPDDLPRVDAEVQMALRGEKNFDTEFRVVWPDKSVHWIKANAMVQHDALGRPVRMLGTNWDVTERKQAHELLQREHQTLKHLLQSSDHERQLIAYEIHDGLAQQLAGAIMQFQTYFHQKETNPKLASKAYDAGMTMLQQGHFESRRLIAGLRPPILDESGIVAAVGHLVNEQSRLKGPKIDYHSSVDFDRLAPTIENSVYRIAQEGLTNACQHSKSERVRVSLVQREDRIQIAIRDWGIGFDTKAVQENRFGLVGIRQRARLLGGKCSIRSTVGEGTRIAVELPVVERE